MTNILSDSNWNQCTYFFHLFLSLDLTMRDTAHQKTWHFKTKHKKNQKIINQERWKQLLVKCKGIMYRCRVFYLDSTLKSIYNKEIFIWHNLLHIIEKYIKSIFRRGANFSQFFFCENFVNKIALDLLIKWTSHVFIKEKWRKVGSPPQYWFFMLSNIISWYY